MNATRACCDRCQRAPRQGGVRRAGTRVRSGRARHLPAAGAARHRRGYRPAGCDRVPCGRHGRHAAAAPCGIASSSVAARRRHDRHTTHSILLYAMPLALRLRRRGCRWPANRHRAAAWPSDRRKALPQGAGCTRTSLSPRPRAARPMRRTRPGGVLPTPAGLRFPGTRRWLRSPIAWRRSATGVGRAGGLLGHDAERQPHPGFDHLDRALLHSRLRQPQHHLRHRDLQLAQGFRGPLHLWPRHRHAGLRQYGLRSAVGQQSRDHLARAASRGNPEGAGSAARSWWWSTRGRRCWRGARRSGCRCVRARTRPWPWG